MSRAAAALAAPPVQTVKVPASELKAAAAWAARIVPLRPPLPILGGVVIGRDDDGHLTLSAFDYETSGRIVVDGADSTFAEPLLVHGRLFAEAAARMSGTVTLEADERTLTVRSGATKVAIRLMASGEYPSLPPTPPAVGRTEADDLAWMVQAVGICADRGATVDQLGLHSMHLTAGDGRANLWATDRYRVAHGIIPWSGADLDVVIPADALAQAVKGMTGVAHIGADEHRVSIAAGDRIVTILQTATPEWAANAARLWSPRGGAITAPRAELADAVATAKIALDAATSPVLLTVTSEGLRVASQTNERADADSIVTADVDAGFDEGWTVAFNATYLVEILAGIDAPAVRIEIDSNVQRSAVLPLEIRGVDADGEPDPGLTYMLVPIRTGGAR